jgi:hypothetical protein
MNGVLNWLKSIDSRFVDESKDRAATFGARQGELSAEQAAAVSDAIVSGQVSAETLAPELLHHLMQQKRGRVPADSRLGQAQAGLAGVIGAGNIPADGSTASKEALIRLLVDRGMVTDQAPVSGPFNRLDQGLDQQRGLYSVANAVGDLRATASPGLGVRLSQAQAGLNNAIATNPYARGAAYAGIGGGTVAGGMGLTEAGRALLELSGVLDAEDEEGSPMPRS